MTFSVRQGKRQDGIDDFIQHWRKHHPILFSQIEDYVFFVYFSSWSAGNPPIFNGCHK